LYPRAERKEPGGGGTAVNQFRVSHGGKRGGLEIVSKEKREAGAASLVKKRGSSP